MNGTHWYISGPMRGIPKYNFPLFDEIRDDLMSLGYLVISPADHDRAVDPLCETRDGFEKGDPSGDFEYNALLGWDLEQIAAQKCRGIILLPGWENSTGAQHERYVAEACGLDVWVTRKSGNLWLYEPDEDRSLSAKRKLGDAKPLDVHHTPDHRRVEGEDIEKLEYLQAGPILQVGLPTDAAARKATPIATGVLDYFPDALAEVAKVSKIGNDQHNPGEPLHWAKEKSTDEGDALIRHFIDRGTIDTDGTRHSAKVAWRALALLQREIDNEKL